MQISRINSNYNNQPSFKGAAEQKYFMETMKVTKLKRAMRKSYVLEDAKPVSDYFSEAFDKLKTHFSNLHDIVMKDNNHFYFDTNGERIHFNRALTNTANCQLDYIEIKPFTADMNKGERIVYYYDVAKNGMMQINRERLLLTNMKNQKNIQLSCLDQIGQAEVLKTTDMKFVPGKALNSMVFRDNKI